jgi:hypothetical protein
MDCFAEPVIGRRFAPTRWLAMTEGGNRVVDVSQICENNFRHSGMRHLAQASDVQLHIGESILPMVVMDSGLARFTRAPE